MAPRGRQTLSLALVARDAEAKACPKDAKANKWSVLSAIETAAKALGLPKSRIAVLDALLSFQPGEDLVASGGLVVFPSNLKLTRRAHLSTATVTRSLKDLTEAGLVLRRDSPNCKRYAKKGQGGTIAQAFGFDLTPLILRADELRKLAAEAEQQEEERKHLRQSISINRREIRKMLETAAAEQLPGDWALFHDAYAPLSGRLSRSISLQDAGALASRLDWLAEDIRARLVRHTETLNMTSSAPQNEEHKQNSTPQPILELEPGLPISQDQPEPPHPETPSAPQRTYPLEMVLKACPDLASFARHGISSWRDFIATAEIVRPYLGISPSAWQEAKDLFGIEHAAILVAAILQRSEAIASAGGYLRSLTRKATAGEFSLGPVLMALIRANVTRKRA
jgi:replication initiation protein RepC